MTSIKFLKDKWSRKKRIILQTSPQDFQVHYLSKEGYYPSATFPPFFKTDLSSTNFTIIKWPRKDKLSLNYERKILPILREDYSWRQYSIISPEAYYNILKIICTPRNFGVIKKILASDSQKFYRYSVLPIFKTKKRTAANGILEYTEMVSSDILRVAATTKYRYLLKIDISNCYGSIYTHSIPWALHGKSIAKKNQKPSLFGNKLDRLFQSMNNRETVGIPIGPIVSDIIYEIIIKKIIDNIEKETKKIDYVAFQFKDDFWFLLPDKQCSEKLLQKLANCFLEYKLVINTTKTRLTEVTSLLDVFPHKVKVISVLPHELCISKKLENKYKEIFPILASNVIKIQKEYPNKSVVLIFLRYLQNTRYSELKSSFAEEIVLWLLKMYSVGKFSAAGVIREIGKIYKNSTSQRVKNLIETSLKNKIEEFNDMDNPLGLIWTIYFLKLNNCSFGAINNKNELVQALINENETLAFEENSATNSYTLFDNNFSSQEQDFLDFNLFEYIG